MFAILGSTKAIYMYIHSDPVIHSYGYTQQKCTHMFSKNVLECL